MYMIARLAILRTTLLNILLVLLLSCSPASTTSQQAPSSLPNNANEPVTLVLWHGWGGAERQVLNRLVDRYNESHPQGRVLLQAVPLSTLASDLRTAVAVGSGPHIVLFPNSWTGSLSSAGVLQPLDDLISSEDQRNLLPAALGGAQALDSEGNRRLYGLPISFDTLALYYNSANVLVPPETTNDLIDRAHGLSDPNAPRWGLALNLSVDNVIGYLYAFGGQVFNEEGELILGTQGREGTEQWLRWLLNFSNDPQLRLQTSSSIAVDRDIKNGQVLMTFGWSHQLSIYRSLWRENLGIAPLPRLSETNALPRPYVKSDLLAINARVGPAERAAAAEFLRFMITVEAQRDLLAADLQPTRLDLDLSGEDSQLIAARAFREQAKQGLPLPNSPTRTIVDEELRIMLERVLMSQTGPDDAVIETDSRLRERLKLPKL